MATDWAADVKKYAPNADDGVIAGIVRYCGIALRKVDSSLVAFSDKKETDRVRENFLKKKLALTQADKTLDAAIAKVGETMKADRTKNRVTVYYLLAENFNKLDLFAPKAKAAAKAPAKKPAGKAAGAAALAGAAGLAAASAAKAPAKKKAAPAKKAAVVGTTKKATTKKVAIKSPAAPQGLMDKAAGVGTAAVAGTVAAAGAVAATTATAAASAAGAVKDTAAKAVDVAGGAAGAVAGAAGAAVVGAAGLASGAADKAGSAVSGAVSQLSGTADDEDSGLGWLLWLLLAALVAFVLWWALMRGSNDEVAAPVATEAAAPSTPAPAGPADLAAAPAEGTVAIPAGAGVTSELRDGKPVVKVYFDTGKTAVVPAFGDAAAGLKAYLDGHAGSSLQVSGFNDPTGGAAANARLSKGRAEAVGAALVAAGIPQTAVALVKPEAATDTNTNLAGARRVEVTVK
jgi:outer membrane protein OmpA-like peptidoglycan-associated protein